MYIHLDPHSPRPDIAIVVRKHVYICTYIRACTCICNVVRTDVRTDIPTNTQADIQTYRQAGRHTAIQTFIIQRGRQTDTHTGCVYFCACWGSCCTHGAGLLADHRLSCLGGCSVSHDVFHFFIRFKNNFRILQDISVFFSCVGSVVGCLWIFGWAAWEKFCPGWNFGGFFQVPTCRTCRTKPTFDWAWRARPMPEAESSWTEWFGESSFSSRSAVLLLTGPVESLGSSWSS